MPDVPPPPAPGLPPPAGGRPDGNAEVLAAVAALARHAARAMVPLLANDHQARNLLLDLASHLREAERDRRTGDDRIARWSSSLPDLARREPQLTELLDLKLFARLRLRECADVLHRPTGELVCAWRRIRRMLSDTLAEPTGAPSAILPSEPTE